jgi:polyhydroxybutyrate depolymerase
MIGLLACIQTQAFTHDGMEREYILYLPKARSEQAPLVFMLHGHGETARAYSRVGMKQQADKHGFAVVFPQGTRDRDGLKHWNAQLDISDTDDMGFLTELAGELQQQHDLDPQRTYTAGISNGGFMSYALVCQAPEVFQAAGSIIGTMSGETWQSCPAVPASIFQISGIDDAIVPIDGSMDPDGGWGGAPEMSTIIDHWVNVNGCAGSVAVDVDDEDTTGIQFSDCDSGEGVRYFKVEGMAHTLPGWDWTGQLAEFLMAR